MDTGISLTSVTLSGSDTIMVQDTTGQMRSLNGYPAGYIPGVDINATPLVTYVTLSAATTFYLVVQLAFSASTAAAYGSLTALRIG